MPTVPEDVSRYLRAVTLRIRDTYRDQLVGVYTTGSLALGDFHPERSDIDQMAVVSKSPSLDLRRQLVSQLDHQVLTCPAAGLEFVLYPLTTVSQPTLDAAYLINFNPGRALPPVTSFDPADGASFCRALSFAHDHCWHAKVPAAERSLPTVGEFAPLVSAAIVSFNSGRQQAALDRDTVRAFLFEVLRELQVQVGVIPPGRAAT